MQPLTEKLAIFDLDDTLFDCTGQLAGVMEHALNLITPFPGINEALSIPGVTNVLVTRGKVGRQMRKIHALKIRPRFESVIVVHTDEEKLETFQAMVGLGRRTWAIGNRLACEIRYGKLCGFTTVYMKHGHYVTSEASSPYIPDHTIHHLTELPAILTC